MNEKSVIHVKSYSFSIRIVRLYQYLIREHKEYSLSKQILRSELRLVLILKKQPEDTVRKNF